MLNEDQLNELKLVRRALNDIHKVLDTTMYKKLLSDGLEKI